jgi:hypothetical protein
MVHYAMEATRNADNTFKTFLLMNPQLVNGGLFLHFYSKRLMLLSAEARSSVLLPDIRPLPSIISNGHMSDGRGHNARIPGSSSTESPLPSTPLHLRIQPRAPLSDEEFIAAFRHTFSISSDDSAPRSQGKTLQLTGWGHDAKIRVIYLVLSESVLHGQQRRDVDVVP